MTLLDDRPPAVAALPVITRSALRGPCDSCQHSHRELYAVVFRIDGADCTSWVCFTCLPDASEGPDGALATPDNTLGHHPEAIPTGLVDAAS